MTHGRNAKTGDHSRSKKGTSLLTGFSEGQEDSLESRVARLEARIEQMQEEIDRLSGVMPAHMQEALDSSGKKHPGPGKEISDTELLLNRDELVKWLEEYWPRIVKALLAAAAKNDTREVAAVLASIAAAPDIRPTWQGEIMDHPAELMEYLRSKKFRRKPPKKTVADALGLYHSEERQRAANRLPARQIANAMAGVPKLKWRTSLDRCSESPCAQRIGYKTAQYYRELFGIPEES
jgi:hypothetical protein